MPTKPTLLLTTLTLALAVHAAEPLSTPIETNPVRSGGAKPDAWQPGTLKLVDVFTDKSEHAVFPQLKLTNKGELIAGFGSQNLAATKDDKLHPHYGVGARRLSYISTDGGNTWTPTESETPKGSKMVYASRQAVTKDGQILCVGTWLKMKPDGTHEYIPVTMTLGNISVSVEDFGPNHPFFNRHNALVLPDGAFLVAGYSDNLAKVQTRKERDQLGVKDCTAVFLHGSADGRKWEYRSALPNPTGTFALNEPAINLRPDGTIVCIARADWVPVNDANKPADVGTDPNPGVMYGYYLYQSESKDFGKTWSHPIQLPIWGHPAELVSLESGDLLMVYGDRRPPYSVRAILSRDNGRTWDLRSMRTLFESKRTRGIDFGYPVATQLADGRIVCLFYDYSSADTQMKSSHGIYAAIFDEKWMESAPEAKRQK